MKTSRIFFIFLTLANIFIFLFKDYFQFIPYSSYESLYTTCDDNCQKKWKQFAAINPHNEVKEAQTILAHQLDLKSKNEIEKAVFIAGFLYTKFKNQNGIPSVTLAVSPLNQYKILAARSSEQLWCGNYALMFAYFCWSQNIPCRYIEIRNPNNYQVINECYIQQLNQWIMVDVTNNMFLIQSRNKYLNAQEFNTSLIKNPASLLILTKAGNALHYVPLNEKAPFLTLYFKGNYPYHSYHLIHQNKIYSPVEKLKRYVLLLSWYGIYTTQRQSNLPFYLKIFCLLLWLGLLGKLIFSINFKWND
jgi:hypothetical protein